MTNPDTPRLTRDLLVDAYASYGRSYENWLIGAEQERHLLDRNGRPLSYDEPGGVRSLMERYIAEGWRPTREGSAPIAVTRGLASVTLEPGGQFELSGAPARTVREIVDETMAFARDLDAKLAGGPARQIALGYTPYARIDDIGWVPKGRYAIMRAHMLTAGTHGHHMMKGTCATQASFDYSDEADCARKMRIATAVAPIVTAAFANSPYVRGRYVGMSSWRAWVWTRTDPARTGFPPASLDWSRGAWVDYLLDVPMMFTKVGGRWEAAHGRTFRSWLERGDAAGRFPGWSDWDLHLTSVFPEVRVKRQIEVRMADGVSIALIGSFCALFQGLFYCQRSTHAAYALSDEFVRFGTPDERHLLAARFGPRGQVGGRRLAAWAERLVDVARSGLSRCDPSAVSLLDPLVDLVEHGECPADRLLRALGPTPDPDALIAMTHPLSGRSGPS